MNIQHLNKQRLYQQQENMQIPQYLSTVSSQIFCSLCCIFTICFLFVKLVALITGWHLLGVLIIIFGVYKLLRSVAIFALYPGCYNYVKSDNQLRGSQKLAESIIKNSQALFGFIHRCQQHPDGYIVAPNIFIQHVGQMISVLQKFQNNLSQRKKFLLRSYRAIQQVIKTQYNSTDISITLENFINNPQQFKKLLVEKNKSNDQIKNIAGFLKDKISPMMRQIHQILGSYATPTQGIIKSIMFKIYGQKLYQIRFAYALWDPKYQYSIHLVETKQSNAVLQCAVIHGKKKKALQTSNSVLISCPNGSFLQYFALQSLYINMYLQMGYQVILWNYRGYGQSTGQPSISTCINDIQAIYNYCRRIMHLDPVISHGYSIGGPPAIHIASCQQFKALVVDRSFCNFINIAQQLSPFLAKLARLVMLSDSKINMSEVYLKIKNTNKIIIWSSVDQVISNGSSLKLGILRRLQQKLQKSNSPNGLLTQEQLYQKESFIKQRDTKDNNIIQKTERNLSTVGSLNFWMQKTLDFFRIVSMLHQAQKYQQTFEINHNIQQGKGFNNSLIEQVTQQLTNKDPSQSVWKNQEHKSFLNKVWSILNDVDGGGATIKFLRGLAQSGIQKQPQLHDQVKSFILGLVFYGSCYDQNGKLDSKMLNNWPQTIKTLKKTEQQLSKLLQEYKPKGPQQLIRYINQFHLILIQIRKHLQKSNKTIDQVLGTILPTQSGHNGQLTQNQVQYLKNAILAEKHSVIQEE